MSSDSELISNRIKGTGWVPDIPDHRDYMYRVTAPGVDIDQLPPKVDLRELQAMQFPILDQGQLGSCTANAISAAITFCKNKQDNGSRSNIVTPIPFFPSRLFIYYNERYMERTINSDSGAMIRDGIKSVNELGACDEVIWPYIIPRFTKRPSSQSYKEALQHQALMYRRIDNTQLNNLKACLTEGFPFVFGFSVYSSFETKAVAQTGIVPMPQQNEQLLGGHAVLCVGYDDSKEQFIVRNSWGDKWGDKGYFYMPYAYLTDTNLSDDFWCITLVEEQEDIKMENEGL